MSAGKWSVTRYENGLWRIWDGDGHHRGSYPTWGKAMRDADRVAAILDRVRDALTDALSEAHHLIYEALGDMP